MRDEKSDLQHMGGWWKNIGTLVTIDAPVVMTSWGKIQRFESFDVDTAVEFVKSNRNKAPEPQAP